MVGVTRAAPGLHCVCSAQGCSHDLVTKSWQSCFIGVVNSEAQDLHWHQITATLDFLASHEAGRSLAEVMKVCAQTLTALMPACLASHHPRQPSWMHSSGFCWKLLMRASLVLNVLRLPHLPWYVVLPIRWHLHEIYAPWSSTLSCGHDRHLPKSIKLNNPIFTLGS